ncbi:uncharacterized protein MICPUCDRAFT_54091 [Micromonas pusilla CCMP1545]|jgi:hypothetical protein|uniref:Predicted protein n=1 Tax=Micromonas pusilla (strain CCMP1545) TaxID=564608 RepID=C1N8H9_MICPC|nr:uncharacterized protein MICPUCDRAFT_54091 [Micromonas pusilla CCMP1545]EEH51709.1 predicted protein [Micromonas pusilla CCMP1545]|tara:strand:+ start:1551 stop:1775 length:225 start_codon:yes stop_codon:yes gene_type:complete|eukprot:XP_003064087.1 predicted protein [Micromonas pusilla CCMP1545]
MGTSVWDTYVNVPPTPSAIPPRIPHEYVPHASPANDVCELYRSAIASAQTRIIRDVSTLVRVDTPTTFETLSPT